MCFLPRSGNLSAVEAGGGLLQALPWTQELGSEVGPGPLWFLEDNPKSETEELLNP